MKRDKAKDAAAYKVVVNQKEQYSIWPAHRENARGWNDAGKSGNRAECLAFIEQARPGAGPADPGKKSGGKSG